MGSKFFFKRRKARSVLLLTDSLTRYLFVKGSKKLVFRKVKNCEEVVFVEEKSDFRKDVVVCKECANLFFHVCMSGWKISDGVTDFMRETLKRFVRGTVPETVFLIVGINDIR